MPTELLGGAVFHKGRVSTLNTKLPLLPGNNHHEDPLVRGSLRKNHHLRSTGVAYLPPAIQTPPSDDTFKIQNSAAATYGAATVSPGNTASKSLTKIQKSSTSRDVHSPPVMSTELRPLRFVAYFRQAVYDSQVETTCVRRVVFTYYPEDGTLSMKEVTQDNDALAEGRVALRRHRVPYNSVGTPKPGDVITYVNPLHLLPGCETLIYGVKYCFVECEGTTRDWIQANATSYIPPDMSVPLSPTPVVVPPGQQFPTAAEGDQYSIVLTRIADTKKGTRAVVSNSHAAAEKRWAQSMRGGGINTMSREEAADARQYFAAVPGRHNFAVVCDQRASSPYGDLLRLSLRHWPADNSWQLCLANAADLNGRDSATLLSRQRIPRIPMGETKESDNFFNTKHQNSTFGKLLRSDYMTLDDIPAIGEQFSVYNYKLTLLDADEPTRDAMNEIGRPLGPGITSEVEAPILRRCLPPTHEGFGSQADSLASWLHLVPRRIKKDEHAGRELAGMTLTWRCYLAPPEDQPQCGCPLVASDRGRKFVFIFHLDDLTAEVVEVQVNNSGHPGGRIVARGHLEKMVWPDGVQRVNNNYSHVPLKLEEVYPGALLTFNSRTFLIGEPDRQNEILLSGGGPLAAPSIHTVVLQLKHYLHSRFTSTHEAYRAVSGMGGRASASGVSLAAMEYACHAAAVRGAAAAAAAIMDRFDVDKDGVLNMTEFIKLYQTDRVAGTSEEKVGELEPDSRLTRAVVDVKRKRLLTMLTNQIVSRCGRVGDMYRKLCLADHSAGRTDSLLTRMGFLNGLRDEIGMGLSESDRQMLLKVIFGENESLSLQQFADAIEAVDETDKPRTNYVISQKCVCYVV